MQAWQRDRAAVSRVVGGFLRAAEKGGVPARRPVCPAAQPQTPRHAAHPWHATWVLVVQAPHCPLLKRGAAGAPGATAVPSPSVSKEARRMRLTVCAIAQVDDLS